MALRICHQMSGSAIPRGAYRKITAASTNMHVTGAEKTLAAQPAQEMPVAAAVVSDGDDDLFGTDYFVTDFEQG